MIPPKIAQLPPAPVRADAPVDFSSKADAMVGALQPFADQANILADFVNDRADDANASATSVEGVQSAVSADRVLSQQAASNAAGSAAAALNSANNASGSATAAQLSANASEASAVRAEDAAQYVEGMTDGAAPISNPNFQGVVRVNSVPLGYAATAPTVGDGVAVLREGAGGWLGQGVASATPFDYPASVADITNLTKTIRSEAVDNGVDALASGIHFSTVDTWGRLRVAYSGSRAWIQGGLASEGTGWTAELYHSQNLFADTSGVMTNGPGQLSNDMSDFLSSNTFADMGSKIGQYENIQRNAAATGTVSINLASASEFDLTLTGNTTIVFDGSVTPTGKSRSFVVRIRQGATARTLTWPASVTWLVVGPITTPAANKICEYVFSYSAESGWFGRIGASN